VADTLTAPSRDTQSLSTGRDKRKIGFSPMKRENMGRTAMPENVYKIIELAGSSDVSISKAIDRAISKAGETVRQLGWFEVTQIRGHIERGKIDSYQVTLKAGFKLEE
jgi:dodecin